MGRHARRAHTKWDPNIARKHDRAGIETYRTAPKLFWEHTSVADGLLRVDASPRPRLPCGGVGVRLGALVREAVLKADVVGLQHAVLASHGRRQAEAEPPAATAQPHWAANGARHVPAGGVLGLHGPTLREAAGGQHIPAGAQPPILGSRCAGERLARAGLKAVVGDLPTALVHVAHPELEVSPVVGGDQVLEVHEPALLPHRCRDGHAVKDAPTLVVLCPVPHVPTHAVIAADRPTSGRCNRGGNVVGGRL